MKIITNLTKEMFFYWIPSIYTYRSFNLENMKIEYIALDFVFVNQRLEFRFVLKEGYKFYETYFKGKIK